MASPHFVLPSSETGTTYKIFHTTPPDTGDPLPAVLFLDGDDQFAAAQNAYRKSREAGSVPPLLLIGVGYGASYMKPANRRIRDYTPTMMSTEAGSGGADSFLRFLSQTLWPELARRFPIRDDVRGLAGHSLGSLLVAHALLQTPIFFSRLLASAPSLWWDNRAALCAAERLQCTGVSRPAKLFLSVGTDDSASMTTDLGLFEDQLAAHPFPELEVISRRFADRDHYNVLEDAFGAGLEALYGRTNA